MQLLDVASIESRNSGSASFDLSRSPSPSPSISPSLSPMNSERDDLNMNINTPSKLHVDVAANDNDRENSPSLSFGTVADTNLIQQTRDVAYKNHVERLSMPMISLPQDSLSPAIGISPAIDTGMNFVYIGDEEEEDEDDGYIYTQEYEHYENEIDLDTKLLVTGFLRSFQSDIPMERILSQSAFKVDGTTNVHLPVFNVLTSKYLCNKVVMFDNRAENKSPDTENTKVVTTSSNGFKYGIHEWSIKIMKGDVDRQEIGVCEIVDNIHAINIQKGGIGSTPPFGARAIYGNELFTGSHYYASYNNNGQTRCRKHINKKIGWCQGDIITTVMNLRKGNIQFYLNGVKVRKTISLQKGKEYHPIIAFSGNCQYELIDYH